MGKKRINLLDVLVSRAEEARAKLQEEQKKERLDRSKSNQQDLMPQPKPLPQSQSQQDQEKIRRRLDVMASVEEKTKKRLQSNQQSVMVQPPKPQPQSQQDQEKIRLPLDVLVSRAEEFRAKLQEEQRKERLDQSKSNQQDVMPLPQSQSQQDQEKKRRRLDVMASVEEKRKKRLQSNQQSVMVQPPKSQPQSQQDQEKIRRPLDVLVSVAKEAIFKFKLEEEQRKKILQSNQQSVMAQPLQPQPEKFNKRKRAESGNLFSADDQDSSFAHAPVSGMMMMKSKAAKVNPVKFKKMNNVELDDKRAESGNLVSSDDHHHDSFANAPVSVMMTMNPKAAKESPVKFKKMNNVEHDDKMSESANLVSADDHLDSFAHPPVSGMMMEMKSKAAKENPVKFKTMNKVELADDQKQKKNKKKGAVENHNSDEIPGLSTEFKNKIYEKARGGLVEKGFLVIQKRLTSKDRFFMPFKMTNKFLDYEEEKFLAGYDETGRLNSLEVDIIEPMGEVETVIIRRWQMKRSNSDSSLAYMLNCGNWDRIAASNHLNVGDYVQLWAVKINGKLCLVFVKLS